VPNKLLFTAEDPRFPVSNALNSEGGAAYQRTAKQHLAQLATTGCFAGTFYISAKMQLDQVLGLAKEVDDEFLAKLAVYSRQHAFMKDMPVALLAILSTRNPTLTRRIFPQVVNNPRMVRTFFQLIRSGQFGRRGFGSALRNCLQRWFLDTPAVALINGTIGNKPSLRDVLRMVRPDPGDQSDRDQLFCWIAGREGDTHAVKELWALQQFRTTKSPELQREVIANTKLRWDLLADSALDQSVWVEIAKQMGHQALRMNLNTLMRHGVLQDATMVKYVADRLGDPQEVQQARQLPYQYYAAYKNTDGSIPALIRQALNNAAELACRNVPQIAGRFVIAIDNSASMNSPTTGHQQFGATSKMTCADAAGLFAAAMLKTNPDAITMPFNTCVIDRTIDPGDTILSITKQLSGSGGGTNCAAPIQKAQEFDCPLTGIVIVSDNESWYRNQGGRGSSVVEAWRDFINIQRGRFHTKPRLVCIDIAPGGTVQCPDRDDVLNVGGFSDSVFQVVSQFLNGDTENFVSTIEAIEL